MLIGGLLGLVVGIAVEVAEVIREPQIAAVERLQWIAAEVLVVALLEQSEQPFVSARLCRLSLTYRGRHWAMLRATPKQRAGRPNSSQNFPSVKIRALKKKGRCRNCGNAPSIIDLPKSTRRSWELSRTVPV